MYGGYLNAYTSKETTAYYIKGFSGNLELFINLMANICFRPVFTQDDFLNEQQIIVDEINSVMDNPEEYLGEAAENDLFDGCSLQHPVSGTVETVQNLTLKDIQEFYDAHYIAENCIIAVCGDVDRDEVLKYIAKYFPDTKESIAGQKPHYKPVLS